MAIRNIVKTGDPILRKKSKPVEKFDNRLIQLLDDMKQTLEKVEGLGLAAVQVGVLKRVFIVIYDDVLYEVINPKILHSEGEVEDNEGCLSVVGFRGIVPRAEKIELEYYDRHGCKQVLSADGYFARVFLHEYDHLDGILFSDKMTKKLIDKD